MIWNLKVNEPSGEIRSIRLNESLTIGRGDQSNLVLRDPTVAAFAAQLWRDGAQDYSKHVPSKSKTSSIFWLKIPIQSPPGQLGGMAVREIQFPVGVPLQLGETQLTIEPQSPTHDLPVTPLSSKPWLTCSESGKELLWMAKKTAATPLSIYLAGETGTGKEVLSHLIHNWSDRKSGPFVPLHCGALPPSLVESELFGHVKGAFTGAIHHRPGALMQAHNGTLFLDEIGDLPLDIQVKLLRFLENGEIKPVGADRVSKANVRLISATHHPLIKLVEEGKFRRDLYYRLASVKLPIPTLRSRPEDVEMLARKYSTEMGKILSPRALLRLQAHCWPGNVRELRHAVERACGLAGSLTSLLGEEEFEFLLTQENISSSPGLELGTSVLSLHEMERVLLLKVLKLTGGNRTKAAVTLGVARSTLFEMLKRHKIKGPRTISRSI